LLHWMIGGGLATWRPIRALLAVCAGAPALRLATLLAALLPALLAALLPALLICLLIALLLLLVALHLLELPLQLLGLAAQHLFLPALLEALIARALLLGQFFLTFRQLFELLQGFVYFLSALIGRIGCLAGLVL